MIVASFIIIAPTMEQVIEMQTNLLKKRLTSILHNRIDRLREFLIRVWNCFKGGMRFRSRPPE